MVTIRKETKDDAQAIRALQYEAFKGHPMHKPGAEPTEHLIVDALRADGALTLSLVAAAEDGTLLGHAAFSTVLIAGRDLGWHALGPIGVLPGHQRGGIGAALMRSGIEAMRNAGAAGIVLVGDPAFYTRFGFTADPALTMPGVPPEYLLSLPLATTTPIGEVTHHQAFHAGT